MNKISISLNRVDTLQSKNFFVEKIHLIVFAQSLLILSSHITIPILPVPFTLQSFAVCFLGLFLGKKFGSLMIISWLIEGFIGFPVFAGPLTGLSDPTIGYLIGMLPACYICGYFAEKGYCNSFISLLYVQGIAYLSLLCCGVLILSLYLGFKQAVIMGLLPFVFSDIIKIISLSVIYISYYEWYSR